VSFLKRILLILLGLALISLVTVVFLVPQALVSAGVRLEEILPVARVIIVVIVDLIILALLYFVVRPSDTPKARNGSGTLVVRASGALADVNPESARERILRAVRDVPDVISAEAKLEPVRGRADIELDVVVAAASKVSVPNKQREIDRALRQVVTKQLGLDLAGRPRVHIQLQDETPRSSTFAASPPPVAVSGLTPSARPSTAFEPLPPSPPPVRPFPADPTPTPTPTPVGVVPPLVTSKGDDLTETDKEDEQNGVDTLMFDDLHPPTSAGDEKKSPVE
jgi:hypothetical protein